MLDEKSQFSMFESNETRKLSMRKFRSSYLASNMRSNSIPYKACYCETNVSASGRAYLKVLNSLSLCKLYTENRPTWSGVDLYF